MLPLARTCISNRSRNAGARLLAVTVVGAALALTSLAPPAAADATGRFTARHRIFEVDGTYSFWSRSAAPDRHEVIKVAVSNAEFGDGFFDDFYDREHAIDTIFVDDQAKVVYFEFEPDGRYRGYSYFFAPGDNCGYCFDSSVRSTVHPVDGHLRGRLTHAGDKPVFDISLDAPIPSKDRGSALPAGGGEPGHAYQAYHAALNAGDRKAAYALLNARQKSGWDTFEAKGMDVLAERRDDLHAGMTRIVVTGGYVRGDRAVVLFDGSSTRIDHLYGEALLQRENGAWRLRDELVSVGTRSR